MPNWCSNTLNIHGDYDTLVQLKSVCETGEGLLQAIRPIPEALKETTSPTPQPDQSNYKGPQPIVDGHDNWYDWCNANWGTKWDPEVHLEFIDNGDGTAEITGHFDTAWAPPEAAIGSLIEDWDSCIIELTYFEPGMGFIGLMDSDGGDAYYENIDELLDTTAEEDPTLYQLLEDYAAADCYDFEEEEE